MEIDNPDVITDFEGSGAVGGDLISLLDIDANESTPIGTNNEAFTFTGNDGFGAFTAAGQLRFEITAAGTIIWGETNGDGKADFSILVQGVHHFSTASGDDFLL